MPAMRRSTWFFPNSFIEFLLHEASSVPVSDCERKAAIGKSTRVDAEELALKANNTSSSDSVKGGVNVWSAAILQATFEAGRLEGGSIGLGAIDSEALAEAGEARTVANLPASLPRTPTFSAPTISSPFHLPQERYNCLEPVSKKEIPVNRGLRRTRCMP